MLGCEVHVFCSGETDKIIKERMGEGRLIIHVLKTFLGWTIQDPIIENRLNIQAFELRALNFIMYENSKRWFDIIHSQSIASVGFMLKHFSNMRWIHTFHSLDSTRLKKMTLKERRLIPILDWTDKTVADADRLIVVSNRFREEVIRGIPGITRKTVTIPNGVDLDLFKSKKSNPLGVLFIGRFSKEKGVEFLPEIIEDVLSKNIRYKFTIVSSGNFKLDEMKPIIEKLEELEKVYSSRFKWYKQPLNEKQIAELYKGASVFIQPSHYETFGMTSLEAMASGLAIVATRVGGLPELIEKTGILCNPHAKEISKNVLKLLKNKKLRIKYGSLASERAKNFEWKFIAKKTLNLYEEVIKETSVEKK